MSVINKMLKDLDDRAPETDMGNPHSASSVYVEKSSKSISKILLLLLGVIATALILIVGKMYFATEAQPVEQVAQQSAAKNASPVTISEQKVTEQNQTEQKTDSKGLVTPETYPSDLASNDTKSGVVESGNSETTQIDAIDAAQTEAGHTLAAKVGGEPNNAEISKPAKPTVKAVEVVNRQVASDPENTEVKAAVKSRNSESLAVPPEQNIRQQPEQESAQDFEPRFVIEKSSSRLTPQQRIEKLVTEAQTAFDKGYITEGIDKLNQVLSIADGHVEARNMLAAAWYGRGELNKAVGILNDGLQRYPQIEQWRLTAAKIFFKENNPVGAFSYLETDLTNGSREYYSMKGSLASQLKRHDKAESAYSQLTRLDPNAGNWWLGLAVAQDSQGKQAQAKDSYQNVLSRGGVSQSSLNFVKQRLTELEG